MKQGKKEEVKPLQTKTDLLLTCNNSLIWIHANKSEANFVSMGNKLSHQRESAVSSCVRCLALPWAALSEALKQTSIAPIERMLCHVLAVITSLRGRASQGGCHVWFCRYVTTINSPSA
jgi:hypothetical protein